MLITGVDVCMILMTCALFFVFFVIIIKKRFDMIDSVQRLIIMVSQEDGIVTGGLLIVERAKDGPATGCIDAP